MTAPVLPILYCFRRCPYAMRARLALLSSSITCELREVVLRNKPPELLAASPKGTVPALITPEGQVIDQSLDIMLWALRQNDPEHWLPTKVAAFDAGMALLARCDGEFKHHLDRYKYPQRYEGANKEASRLMAALFVVDLEALLTQNHYIFGSSLSILDAGIAPFMRQFAHVDAVWFASQRWPRVQAWLVAFETSDALKQVMTAHPPWALGAPITVFPSIF